MRIIFIILLITSSLSAQENYLPQDSLEELYIDYYEDDSLEFFDTEINGRVMSAMVTESGDTLIMDKLNDISITSLRRFKSVEDYNKYMKFRRYAAIVYPYAREAIKIFKETEYVTATMKKRKRKKHINKLQDELKVQFEEPLKQLTKLQGKILIKMIERELDKNMYELIKSLRGSLSAFYWHNSSKLYSYDLKEGYEVGKYEILDAVLNDFDISYRIEQEERAKTTKDQFVRDK